MLPVNLKSTNDNFLADVNGQAVAEYACMLAAVLGLLVLISAFGFSAGRVFSWISANLY